MNNFIFDAQSKEEYDNLHKEIVKHIEQTVVNVAIIKEKAILEVYWHIGEALVDIGDISNDQLKLFRNDINKQLKNDPIFHDHSTNTQWLTLAKTWVTEHHCHDKTIILSGKVTWIQWALILNIVNSTPQRYWLACQTVLQKWDAIALLQAARSLPGEYLNIG